MNCRSSETLPEVTRIAGSIGLDLRGAIVSLDGVYDCLRNRKAIFNRGMISGFGGRRCNFARLRNEKPVHLRAECY